jgi:Integrase zinc binding domain
VYIKGEMNAADGLSRQADEVLRIRALNIETNEKTKEKFSKEYHKESGYGSVNTMEFLINQRYKWTGIHEDIRKYVSSCTICLKSGGERINTKNTLIRTNSPNELCECDLAGRLEDKNENNKFIFTAIDHYSKWMETKVLESKTAVAVVEAIEELEQKNMEFHRGY